MRIDCLRVSDTIYEWKKSPMDGAVIEEEIGNDIRKGDRARKLEAIRHGRDRFQDIIEAKESITGFMQRREDSWVWGYYAGHDLWRVVDGRHGAGKWVWIFSVR